MSETSSIGETAARVIEPQQDRSRETLGRIVHAARELMDGRDYQSISVQEICRLARVSASSFYARFETKEDLLFAIHDAHRENRVAELARYARDVGWDTLPLTEVVRRCLRVYLEDRRRLAPLLKSLMLAELRFPDIAIDRAHVDSLGVEFIRSRLLERLGSSDPELSRRIEFAMRTVCTAAQEAIRPPALHAQRMGLSDDELIDRLADMFCRYVGIDPESPPIPPPPPDSEAPGRP